MRPEIDGAHPRQCSRRRLIIQPTTQTAPRDWSAGRRHEPVVSEEDVVALVVQRHDASALELGVEVEQRGQHAAHPVTQHGGEVVEHHLRSVVREFLDPLPEATQCERKRLIRFNGKTQY